MSRWHREHVEYIEGDNIPPSNLPKYKVEDYAERVAKFYVFSVGQDPAELVETVGGRINFQDLDDWSAEDGSIFVHDEFDFDILLSRYTSPLRDRFTICHELGHYFLHSDQGEQPIIAHRRGSTRIEWEANWFAASLLMPKKAFLRMCNETKDLLTIARIFGVSEDAARVRRDALCG